MSSTWGQLQGAVLTLVRSGTIKDRLAEAFRNHLAHLNADDLPDCARAEFRACHDTLTRERPLRGEDAVRATVRKMSTEEADEVACSVVRIFGAMTHEPQRVPLPAAPAEPRVVGTVVNGAHNDVHSAPADEVHTGVVDGAIALNGALKGRRKAPKRVPQIISLYAGEA
ncbi:MAG TPA: hypothetical protein VK676_10875 [Steroidobacteraceae bacterium]|jgi:hypothetical protein|nr:hypothetical protein [Steroidobacteraceae bacterium]